jgi:hypothetical protein
MTHTVGNMWMSNDTEHNIMCDCFEVFTHPRIGTVVRMYSEHLVRELQHV